MDTQMYELTNEEKQSLSWYVNKGHTLKKYKGYITIYTRNHNGHYVGYVVLKDDDKLYKDKILEEGSLVFYDYFAIPQLYHDACGEVSCFAKEKSGHVIIGFAQHWSYLVNTEEETIRLLKQLVDAIIKENNESPSRA